MQLKIILMIDSSIDYFLARFKSIKWQLRVKKVKICIQFMKGKKIF